MDVPYKVDASAAAENVGQLQLDIIEEGTVQAKSEVPPKWASQGYSYPRTTSPPDNIWWTSRPRIARLVVFGCQLKAHTIRKVGETYPRILDTVKYILKLVSLTLLVIFVVMLASWMMALSHWFTVVFGHLVLRYAVPPQLDDAFVTKRLDFTMIFAAIGAFVVNFPPFIIFLLSFPWTFDRVVLESSTAPVNEFIKRITPKNRIALLFMKYAPRLAAGPIGCVIFWIFTANVSPETDTLNPIYATLAGIAGEIALCCVGRAKNLLRGKSGGTPNEMANSKDNLPL